MLATRLAHQHMATHARVKTAGEVRFIKDRGGDDKQWGWPTPGPNTREINGEFKFDAKNLKPLALVLRATLASMGHALSAYDSFTRLKSAKISPDGALGGKGYIQKIAEMRRAYMNTVESLSALSDTIYDEMQAPHWNPAVEEQSNRERTQVVDIMSDVEDIREDPEGWAEDEEEGMSGSGGEAEEPGEPTEGEAEDAAHSKKARKQARDLSTTVTKGRLESTAAARVAARYLTRSAE
jgi:hypothetical protein